jgi:N-terminal domain of ribose phosphate pyrophosphokinase
VRPGPVDEDKLLLGKKMWRSFVRSGGATFAAALASSAALVPLSMARSAKDTDREKMAQQPAFVSLSSVKPSKKKDKKVTLDTLVLISGTSHPELAKEVSSLVGVPLADAELKRFADGEVSVQLNENLRGKDVFVIQSCAAPVNDSIMELLLTVSCAR